MDKILSYENIENQVKEINKQGKVVLAGGCFDILHPGHLFFLNKAKNLGDVLIVALEGDESITKRKGKDRPINSVGKRMDALEKLEAVDYILPLPYLKTDLEYFNLVKKLEPDIIAVTVGDLAVSKKVEQARTVGGKVVEIEKLPEHSTTNLINKKTMKKVLLFYALLVIAVIAFALSRGTNLFNFGTSTGSATAKIENKTYKLILAKTDPDRIKGLSGKSNLASDSGMLFTFPQKDTYAFWMKEMLFPIDIIYIDDNKVVDFVENAPAPTSEQNASTLPIYKPSASANYVLEVNANEVSKNKIKKGDSVTFSGIK